MNLTISDPQSAIDQQSEISNLRLLCLVVAVSGFASLALEIVWFRLMLQFVVATTEAFTAMLTTVLGGIAVGGMLAAVILRSRARSVDDSRHRPGDDRRRRGREHVLPPVDREAGLGNDGAMARGA